MPIVEAVRAKISSDPTVANGLATWEFESGQPQKPAVFTQDPAPERCASPLVVLTSEGGDDRNEAECRGLDTLSQMVQIRLWGKKQQSDLALRRLAWNIHDLFFGKKKVLEIEGWSFVSMRIGTPQKLMDGDGFPGYMMNVIVNVARRNF